MPKQTGIIRVEGTMDNVTFYKDKEGVYHVRRKGGVSAERIAKGETFQRTRENGAEFGRAGKASKLLREILKPLGKHVSDGRMFGRLVREMMKVLRADATSERGQRNVIDGEVELLNGFDFNSKGPLKTSVSVLFSAAIDRITGKAQVDFPAFIPSKMIIAPQASTHYQLNAVAAEIDFEAQSYKIDSKNSGPLQLTEASAGLQLACQLPANSTHPLFLVLGIEFFQMSNGRLYPLLDSSGNPAAIVQVSGL